jgi:hypothetical protein
MREFSPLISHLCWENLDYSATIMRLIVDGIAVQDHDGLKPMFRAAGILVQINDEAQVGRWSTARDVM